MKASASLRMWKAGCVSTPGEGEGQRLPRPKCHRVWEQAGVEARLPPRVSDEEARRDRGALGVQEVSALTVDSRPPVR